MTKIIKFNAPSLGGHRKAAGGMEPSLSKDHKPARAAAVARLAEQLRSRVTHDRFNAVLTLADYPDHPRAVGAIIRTVRDDIRLMRFAAIFALGVIGPRLTDPMLRGHAIKVLCCTLREDSPQIIPWVALKVLLITRSWQHSTAGRALAGLLSARMEHEHDIVALQEMAVDALRSIGTPDALAALETLAISTTAEETVL